MPGKQRTVHYSSVNMGNWKHVAPRATADCPRDKFTDQYVTLFFQFAPLLLLVPYYILRRGVTWIRHLTWGAAVCSSSRYGSTPPGCCLLFPPPLALSSGSFHSGGGVRLKWGGGGDDDDKAIVSLPLLLCAATATISTQKGEGIRRFRQFSKKRRRQSWDFGF